MDARELEEIMKRLSQSLDDMDRKLQDTSKQIDELERNNLDVKQKMSLAVEQQAKLANDNKGLQFAADKVEDSYENEIKEIEKQVQEIEQQRDELEKRMADARKVLDELVKVDKDLKSYKFTVDNWMNEARKFI